MKPTFEGSRMAGRTWSIVLGGGDGGCMTDFIQRWLGYPRPKQYCTFVGDRSLFQHTLDRASALCRQEHIVALVAREHGQEAWSQLEARGAGTVLLQPRNRDSAAGMYLSLTYLKAKDPHATVVIYPWRQAGHRRLAWERHHRDVTITVRRGVRILSQIVAG